MEVYRSHRIYSLYLLMLYTIRLTAAVTLAQVEQNLCSTFSTITYEPTATFTFGPAEGCFVLQPCLVSQSATVTSSTSLSIVRRCPAVAHDAPLVDDDPCAEGSTNRSRSSVTTTTSMPDGMSFSSLATSVADHLPAVTGLTVLLANGNAEYICTLMAGSSWTSTPTPALNSEFWVPLASSSLSAAQDADQINSLTGVATSFSLDAPLSKSTTLNSQGICWVSSLIIPGTTNISPVEKAPISAEGVPGIEPSLFPSSVPLSAEGYTAATSAEGSTAVTTIDRFITQIGQIQVVSTTGTADLQTSPSERIDSQAPISVPGSAVSTNLGQLIAQPFQTAPSPIVIENTEEAPIAKSTQILTPSVISTAPLTDIANLPGQPTSSAVFPLKSTAAALTQTISDLVILATPPPQTETTGNPTNNDESDLQQDDESSSAIYHGFEVAPVSATGVAVAVTPGQSITYFPTVCLAALYSPTISYITQYHIITVTATPNSTSPSTFSRDNTTFHLSIVTIAPTGASTTIAAPSSKSEAGDNWTRWRFVSAVFVGLLVSLYGTVG